MKQKEESFAEKKRRAYLQYCLWIARQDKTKATEFFDNGCVPIDDVIRLVDWYSKLEKQDLADYLDISKKHHNLAMKEATARKLEKEKQAGRGKKSGEARRNETENIKKLLKEFTIQYKKDLMRDKPYFWKEISVSLLKDKILSSFMPKHSHIKRDKRTLRGYLNTFWKEVY
ncbi:MAG: hypothetical protein JNN04_09930 [Cyclobacteriaceae bacterium]|nr:hypothetical protein [Cyclobacteriaceae bacterium]